MTTTNVFQPIDTTALEEEIGAWEGVLQELSYFHGNVANKVNQIKTTWVSPASKRFFEWWWGSADNPNAGLGAKADLETLEKMITAVIAAIKRFNLAVDDINRLLLTASEIIDAHAYAPGLWRAWVVTPQDKSKHVGDVVYSQPSGTLHAQKIVDGLKCYITFFELQGLPFPYGDGTLTNTGIIQTPQWYLDANRSAHKAAEAYVVACNDCITKLTGMLKRLSPKIHKLTPFTNEFQYPWSPVEYVGSSQRLDPTWAALTGEKYVPGDKYYRPWNIKDEAPHSLRTVTYKPGHAAELAGGGDPFDPVAPKWYFSPSTLSKVVDYFAKYGVPVLSVLLASTGVGAIADLVDGIFDSGAFLAGVGDFAAGGSVEGLAISGVGTALDGFDIVVDATKVKSVAEFLAKQLVGDEVPEGYTESADQLIAKVRDKLIEKIKAGTEKDGQYLIDPSQIVSGDIEGSGKQSIVSPIQANPGFFSGKTGEPRAVG